MFSDLYLKGWTFVLCGEMAGGQTKPPQYSEWHIPVETEAAQVKRFLPLVRGDNDYDEESGDPRGKIDEKNCCAASHRGLCLANGSLITSGQESESSSSASIQAFAQLPPDITSPGTRTVSGNSCSSRSSRPSHSRTKTIGVFRIGASA